MDPPGHIIQLQNDNYAEWKFKTELLLAEKLLSRFIQEDALFPANNTQAARDKFDRQKAEARKLICFTVYADLLSVVRSTTTPRQAWLALERHFADRNPESSGPDKQREFLTLKMGESDDVQSYVDQFKCLAEKINTPTVVYTDSALVDIFLTSLSSSYDTTRQILRSSPNLTFVDACSRVIKEAKTREKQAPQRPDAAMLHSTRSLKPDLSGKSTRSKNAASRNTASIICSWCKRPGHLETQCLTKLKALSEMYESRQLSKKSTKQKSQAHVTATLSSSDSDSNSETEEQANSVCALVSRSHGVCFSSGDNCATSKRDPAFYLDSACSRHMCNDKDKFHTFHPFRKRRKVYLGDDTHVISDGYGTILMVFTDLPSGECYASLENVYHVPKIAKNLIACRVLDDKGFKGHFGDGQFIITKTDNATVVLKSTLTQSSGLYKVHSAPRDPFNFEMNKTQLSAALVSVKATEAAPTCSPVDTLTSLRTILAAAAQRKMFMHHCMKQPDSFVDNGNHKIDAYLQSVGFVQNPCDPCTYYKLSKLNQLTIIALYIDEFVICGDSQNLVDSAKKAITARFKMTDLGGLIYCLGIQVHYEQPTGSIHLSQSKYTDKLLTKYGMADCKSVATPQEQNTYLAKHTGTPVDLKNYQSLIGSLNYLAHATRPDICSTVISLCQHASNPGTAHWALAKRVLRYLKGTVSLGLLYSDTNNLQLSAFSDADWGGDIDRKSVSGGVFYLSGGPVNWYSRKQHSVAVSTAEAEYVAASQAAQEVVPLRQLLVSLGFEQLSATTIWEDNQSCIAMCRSDVSNQKTKHIDNKVHSVRDLVKNNTVQVQYCKSEEMIADVMTKALGRIKFQKFKNLLVKPPITQKT